MTETLPARLNFVKNNFELLYTFRFTYAKNLAKRKDKT